MKILKNGDAVLNKAEQKALLELLEHTSNCPDAFLDDIDEDDDDTWPNIGLIHSELASNNKS